MSNKCTIIPDEPEIWKDVPGYEGRYQVSTIGRIRTLRCKHATHRVLGPTINMRGYYRVTLCVNWHKKHVELHRLIGLAFIPNVDNKPCINHKNGIKTDNRVSNLEWCTSAENSQHAFRMGLVDLSKRKPVNRSGALNPVARKIAQFDLRGNKLREYETSVEAEMVTGICRVAIRNCAHGRSRKSGGYIWKFVDKFTNQ